MELQELGSRIVVLSKKIKDAAVSKGNPCHKPAGSSDGGQFCETGGGGKGGARHVVGVDPNALHMERLKSTLKVGDTVAEAVRRAFHRSRGSKRGIRYKLPATKIGELET